MTSIREQALDGIKAILDGVTSVSGRVYRSRTNPVDRAKLPCIIVTPVIEQFEGDHIPRGTWKTLVRVTIIGRGGDADGALDPVLNDAYARLMADRTLGGKVQDIVPVQNVWAFSEGDGSNCQISCDFQIQYQTNASNMEV